MPKSLTPAQAALVQELITSEKAFAIALERKSTSGIIVWGKSIIKERAALGLPPVPTIEACVISSQRVWDNEHPEVAA